MSTVTSHDIIKPPLLPQIDAQGVIDISQMQNDSLIIYVNQYSDEKNGDRVVVCVGDTIRSGIYFITESVPDFIVLNIPFTKIPAGKYSVTYMVYDFLHNVSISQPATVTIINPEAQCGTLYVMGARGKYGTERYAQTGIWSRTLIALDKESRTPVSARWRYEGDQDGPVGERFLDISPWRPLHVSTGSEEVTLNPVNISGNSSAFAALRTNGSVVCWGAADTGGNAPPAVSELSDIVAIATTSGDFSALRANGGVACWGHDPVAVDQSDIVRLFSNDRAFVAAGKDGGVMAWGDAGNGGSVPAEISKLRDITQVVGTIYAFAALRKNNSVVAWGDDDSGGSIPPAISNMNDIVQLFSGSNAVVALRANGSVVAWGRGAGASIPPAVSELTDIVRVVSNANFYPANSAFVALRKDGSVVAWGDSDNGASIPADIRELKDIIDVIGIGDSFLALRHNGSIAQWGMRSLPDEVMDMRDIVQIINPANCGTFSVLRASGQVYSWGGPGGPRSPIVNARAIYCNGNAFAALTEDGQVISWGNREYGGDSSAVQPELAHQVSYQRN